MKKLFTKLSGFFKRKGYQPDQADMPVFDESSTSEEAQPSGANAPVQEFNLIEELKKAKAEIAEVNKAFKEEPYHQA